jgi:DNA-binding SARP family transcriptional activator
LRSKFLDSVTRLGRYYESLEQWERTADYYERGIEVDDLAEEFYQGLMACYHRLGQRAKAAAVYRRCREVLSAVLGVAPSPKTEDIYRMIIGG